MFVWKLRAYIQSHNIQNGTSISLGTFDLSIGNFISLLRALIPGLRLLDAGYYPAGRLVWWTWLSLSLIALVWIGRPLGNTAYALMISLHASSLIFLLTSQSPQQRILRRILQPLLIVLLLAQVIYPLAGYPIRHYWLLPLALNGKHILINRLDGADSIKRGDYVAYKIDERNRAGILRIGGYAFEKIIAGPSDRIVFETQTFTVNGESFPTIRGMPQRGSRVVPEGSWFIWPTESFQINRGGHDPFNIGENGFLEKLLLGLAIVPNTNIIGKPFNNWLWHPPTP
ncbi:MAG: hypothetical protein WCO60_15125 [Verrucomicrobiota bacterium]